MLTDPKHGIGIDHFIIKKQIRQLFQPVAVCRRIENIRDNFNVVIREEIDRLVKKIAKIMQIAFQIMADF